MPSTENWAVFIDNTSEKGEFIDSLSEGHPHKEFKEFEGKSGILFSRLALERFIEEEERHGTKILTADTDQALKSMSSGERKKALLRYILSVSPDFIILDNPFDNLDADTQAELRVQLEAISKKTAIVQLLSRRTDLLPFIHRLARLKGSRLLFGEDKGRFALDGNPYRLKIGEEGSATEIPQPLHPVEVEGKVLIELKDVNVSFGGRPILKNLNWTVRKDEFWQLQGKNGSGKTTILSMITGENTKGYGQDLYIFGRKKGSGESIWDIKKNIGYFTPAMTDRFTGRHSVESMIVSGLNDSIGLYIKPTEVQLRTARKWLRLIEMQEQKGRLFQSLSMGQKRLVMCARAMVKHPPLLILDEPTAGLDDASADLFVALVNKFSNGSETTILFVSHRDEPGLEPEYIYQLEMTGEGSLGKVQVAKI